MTTNLLARLIVTLVTNVTNITVELPMAGPPGLPSSERYVMTNVFERSTITWVMGGRTNSAESSRLIYSATQVLKLKQTWEPGELRIQGPR